MEYFYHLLPASLKGNILYPLSTLKDIHPILAKSYIKSYKDRTSLLNKQIKILDCVWQDVLFCSAVNPILIFSALDLLGLLDENPPTILQFPITALRNTDFCFYQEISGKHIFDKETVAAYQEEFTLPVETVKYFASCIKSKESPLIFASVPHILIKGSLDIKLSKELHYKRF